MKTKSIFILLPSCLLCAALYAGTDSIPAVMEQQFSPPSDFAIKRINIRSVHYGDNDPLSHVAMFGDTIAITVTAVELIEKKRSMSNPIILYLNRIPFPNIVGHLAGARQNEIKFILSRSFEDNEIWDKVLRSGFIRKSLYLGVGLQDGSLITPVSFPVQFTLRTPAESVPFILLCIVLGCFTIFIVWKRRLLQEKIQGYYIYSLSSVHLFFWTQIILLSYILIWFVCDDMNSIDSSNLILLGISAGTASISTVINGSSKNGKRTEARPSEGFFRDILSDNHELSMHRYQIFIFNCVIGAFFIYKTVNELKMPVLSETVLALLGISSATYTAMKAISGTNLLKPGAAGQQAATTEKTEAEKKEQPDQ